MAKDLLGKHSMFGRFRESTTFSSLPLWLEMKSCLVGNVLVSICGRHCIGVQLWSALVSCQLTLERLEFLSRLLRESLRIRATGAAE